MENNHLLKKYLINALIIITLFVGLLLIILKELYYNYNQNVNYAVNGFIETILTQYEDVSKSEIASILNSVTASKHDYLREYGIDLKNDSLVLKNETLFDHYIVKVIILMIILGIVLIIGFMLYNRKRDQKIKEIMRYMEEINNKNYKLDIESNTEEELSILKNELYKMTVMLKEQAENSLHDKLKLKNSLEDISHQLKTPLTAINIMLDNILDGGMNDEVCREFLHDIRRETDHINLLVLSLLKLSKFDANTIVFDNKAFFIKDLISEVLLSVDKLRDLKKIDIIVDGSFNDQMVGDLNWQKEALVNIVKNCIEHSDLNGQIVISYEENKLYSKIVIRDHGRGIDKEDLPHIFERFYKGKNSSSDNVGIGLALARAIIQNNNGDIVVDSKLNDGTTFTIKYFK